MTTGRTRRSAPRRASSSPPVGLCAACACRPNGAALSIGCCDRRAGFLPADTARVALACCGPRSVRPSPTPSPRTLPGRHACAGCFPCALRWGRLCEQRRSLQLSRPAAIELGTREARARRAPPLQTGCRAARAMPWSSRPPVRGVAGGLYPRMARYRDALPTADAGVVRRGPGLFRVL